PSPQLAGDAFERAERPVLLEGVDEARRAHARVACDQCVVGRPPVAVHPDPLEAERAHHLDVGELRLGGERPGDDELGDRPGYGGELAAELVLARAQEAGPRLAAVEIDVDEVALRLQVAGERPLPGPGRTRDQQESAAFAAARVRKKSMVRHLGPNRPPNLDATTGSLGKPFKPRSDALSSL